MDLGGDKMQLLVPSAKRELDAGPRCRLRRAIRGSDKKKCSAAFRIYAVHPPDAVPRVLPTRRDGNERETLGLMGSRVSLEANVAVPVRPWLAPECERRQQPAPLIPRRHARITGDGACMFEGNA